jgi:hypothetical protein
MSVKRFLYTAAAALSIAGAFAACTTASPNNPSMTDAAASATAPGPGLYKTSDLVFEYRRQATELREIARQLEMEAALYAQRQNQEQAARNRELAKDARSAADAADQQSRDYRRQLPHGQVY